ncbi:hypothetical protein J5N97_017742 [Dioscorea zingiberensis]|uniref:Uncharacterized protein n=1 Tax=Dioscorea zingiberensis TaxID=325984 RepID=A0A9D5CNX1_9LILI|nr:hypothetical protein J5N97_017742 [Dioscorea zingiberensis]
MKLFFLKSLFFSLVFSSLDCRYDSPGSATATCLPFERRLRITFSLPNQVAFPDEFSSIHLQSVSFELIWRGKEI